MGARKATILRVLKPVIAGIAIAYAVTAFVDKPAPVHFQPENPYASKQAEVAEPQTDLVLEENIMKLGSPLSVRPEEIVPDDNPLAALQESGQEQSGAADNATVTEPSSIRGGVVSPSDEP